jgi:hypothetical protein
MTEREMQYSLQLEETVATMISDAEQYPVIQAKGQAVVASFAIPNAKSPKIILFCRSIKDFIKAFENTKTLSDSPEEFAINIIENQVRRIKSVHPGVIVMVVLGDYKEERLDPDEAEEIMEFIDVFFINEEVKHLPEAINAILKES